MAVDEAVAQEAYARFREVLRSCADDASGAAALEGELLSALGNASGVVLHSRAAASEKVAAYVGQGGGRVCGRVFTSGDLSYTCLTCAADGTCVQCQDCFESSRHLHEGHEVGFHFAGSGGTCDCGDEEAWAHGGTCPQHAPHGAGDSDSDPSSALPSAVRQTLEGAFRAVGHFLQVVAADVGAAHRSVPRVEHNATREWDARFGGRYSARIPEEETMPPLVPLYGGVGSAREEEGGVPPLESAGRRSAARESAEAASATTRLQALGRQGPAEGVGRVEGRLSAAGPPPDLDGLKWRVMIHNDDVHTYADVHKAFELGSSMSPSAAQKLTTDVDKVGEGVFPTTYTLPSDEKELKRVHEELSKAGLQFSIQPQGLIHAQGTAIRAWEVCLALAKASAGAARVLAVVWASAAHFPEAPQSSAVGVGRMTGFLSNYPWPHIRAEADGTGTRASPVPVVRLPSHDVVEFHHRGLASAGGTSLLLALTRWDMHMQHKWRVLAHDLYTRLLRVPAFRLQFGRAFLSSYPCLIRQWASGVGTHPDSIFHLSVQLMTVPSIINSLRGVSGLAPVVAGLLYRVFQVALTMPKLLPISGEPEKTQYNGCVLASLPLVAEADSNKVLTSAGLSLTHHFMQEREAGVRWHVAFAQLTFLFRQAGVSNAVFCNEQGAFPSLTSSGLVAGSSVERMVVIPCTTVQHVPTVYPERRGQVGTQCAVPGCAHFAVGDGGWADRAPCPPPAVEHMCAAHAGTSVLRSNSLVALLAGFHAVSNLDGHYRKSGTHVDHVAQEWQTAANVSNELASMAATFVEHLTIDTESVGGQGSVAGTPQPDAGLRPPVALDAVSRAVAALASTVRETNFLEAHRHMNRYVQDKEKFSAVEREMALADARELAGCSDIRRCAALGSYGPLRRAWQHPVSHGPVSLYPNAHRFVADCVERVAVASLCAVTSADGSGGDERMGTDAEPRLVCIDPLPAIKDMVLGACNPAEASFRVTTQLLAPPLRAIVFAGQVSAGLWSRNGSEDMASMVASYSREARNTVFTRRTYDRDVKAVHVAVMCLEPQAALAALLAEWQLLAFFETPAANAADLEASSLLPIKAVIVPGSLVGPYVFPPIVAHAGAPAEPMGPKNSGILRALLAHLSPISPASLVREKRKMALIPLPQQRMLIVEFLKFFAGMVTDLPIATGGRVSPDDAPFVSVEGGLASSARAMGSALPHPLVLPGEAELAAGCDSALGVDSKKRSRPIGVSREGSGAPVASGGGGPATDDDVQEASSRRRAVAGPTGAPESAPATALESAVEATDSWLMEVEDAPAVVGPPAALLPLPLPSSLAVLDIRPGERVVKRPDALHAQARRAMLRNELIHLLASGRDGAGKPRSALSRFASAVLDERWTSNVDDVMLTSVLAEIAEYREASSSEGSSLYVLKDSVLTSEYDWMHPHLSSAGHSAASQWWSARRKAQAAAWPGGPGKATTMGRARPIAPPPPPANPAYLSVRRLLHTVASAHMYRTLLSDAVLAAVHAPAITAAAAEGPHVAARLPEGSAWMVWPDYALHLAGQRTSDAAVRGTVHVLTLALHAWPQRRVDSTTAPVGETVADVFADALVCENLQLPYGGPWQAFPSLYEQPSFDIQRRFGCPCPPVTTTLHAIMRTESFSEDVREGAAWCLNALLRVNPVTEAAVRAEMGAEMDAAAAEERATGEASRKTDMEARRKAAQDKAMANMRAKQASLMAKFADSDEEDEGMDGAARMAGTAAGGHTGSGGAGKADSASVGSMDEDMLGSSHSIDLDAHNLLGVARLPLQSSASGVVQPTSGALLTELMHLETPPPPPACILCEGGAEREGKGKEAGEENNKGAVAFLAHLCASSLAYHTTATAATYCGVQGGEAGWAAPGQSTHTMSNQRDKEGTDEAWKRYVREKSGNAGPAVKGDRYDGGAREAPLSVVGIRKPTTALEASQLLPLSRTHGLKVSFCGHAAHMSCLTSYASGQQRAMSDTSRPEGQDLTRYLFPTEFACPLCRGIANGAVQYDGSHWPAAALSRAAVPRSTLSAGAPARLCLSSSKVKRALTEALHGPKTLALFPDARVRGMLGRTGLATTPLPTMLEGVTGLAMKDVASPGLLPGWFALPAGVVMRDEEAKQVTPHQDLPYVRFLALCRSLGFLPIMTERAVQGDALSPDSVNPLLALSKGYGGTVKGALTTETEDSAMDTSVATSAVSRSAALYRSAALHAARKATAHVDGTRLHLEKQLSLSTAPWVYADGRVPADNDEQAAKDGAEGTSGLDSFVCNLSVLRTAVYEAGFEVDYSTALQSLSAEAVVGRDVIPSGMTVAQVGGSGAPAHSGHPGATTLVRHRLQLSCMLGASRHAELLCHPLAAAATEVTRRTLTGGFHVSSASRPMRFHGRALPGVEAPSDEEESEGEESPLVPAAAQPAAFNGTQPATSQAMPAAGPATVLAVALQVMVPPVILATFMQQVAPSLQAAGLTIAHGAGSSLLISVTNPQSGTSQAAVIIEALANVQVGAVGGPGAQPDASMQMLMNLIAEGALSAGEQEELAAAGLVGGGVQPGGANVVFADMDPNGGGLVQMANGGGGGVEDEEEDEEEDEFDDEEEDDEDEEDGEEGYGEEDDIEVDDDEDGAGDGEEGDNGQPPLLPMMGAGNEYDEFDAFDEDEYEDANGVEDEGVAGDEAGGFGPSPAQFVTAGLLGTQPSVVPSGGPTGPAAAFFQTMGSLLGGMAPPAGAMGLGGAPSPTGVVGAINTFLQGLMQMQGPGASASPGASPSPSAPLVGAFPTPAGLAGFLASMAPGQGAVVGGGAVVSEDDMEMGAGFADLLQQVFSGPGALNLPPGLGAALAGSVAPARPPTAGWANKVAVSVLAKPMVASFPGESLVVTSAQVHTRGLTLFEPLVHHPLRAGLAALLGTGQTTVLPYPVSPDLLRKATAGWTHVDAILTAVPYSLAVFLRKPERSGGCPASAERPFGDATPVLTTVHRRLAVLRQARPDLASLPVDTGLTDAHLAALMSDTGHKLCLGDVEPLALLLALAAVAPTPAHVLHAACLGYVLAVAQLGGDVSGAEGGHDRMSASSLGSVDAYLRAACIFLAMLSTPTPAAVSSVAPTASADDAKALVGPAVEAFTAFVDSFGVTLTACVDGAAGAVAMQVEGAEGGGAADGDEVVQAAHLLAAVSSVLPYDALHVLSSVSSVSRLDDLHDSVDEEGHSERGEDEVASLILASLLHAIVASKSLATAPGATTARILGLGKRSPDGAHLTGTSALAAYSQGAQLGSVPSPLSFSALLCSPGVPAVPFQRLSLIPLPLHFDALYSKVRGRQCRACGKAPKSPALCLACGVLLCGGDECCRQARVETTRSRKAGELTRHARTCGGGTGVFLLLQPAMGSQTLIIRGKHAAYAGSPYADSHGETDVGLHRGKLLRLSARRYSALSDLWARGGVGREVAHMRLNADRFVVENHY